MGMVYHFSNEIYTIGIWKIEESKEYYIKGIDFTTYDTAELSNIKNESKIIEWLASRFLLKKISNETKQLVLLKHESGRPFFNNTPLHFSISHSSGYVAAIISPFSNVAIDIEVPNEKTLRIEHKYTNLNDYSVKVSPRKVEDMTLVWSAKESLYKYYDISGLSLKNNISIYKKTKHVLYAEVFLNGQKNLHQIHYQHLENLVVTYVTSDIV